MSTIKLDLKQFKHVKSDGDTTTLQHKSGGHTLTIKHSSLGPEARQQLQALSGVSQSAQTVANTDELKHKGLAEGGPVPYAPPMKGPSRGSEKVKLELPKKEPMGKVIMKAEGGEVADHEHEGSKFCMHCGGEMPKMYAGGTGYVEGDEGATHGDYHSLTEDLGNIGSSLWQGAKSIMGAGTDQPPSVPSIQDDSQSPSPQIQQPDRGTQIQQPDRGPEHTVHIDPNAPGVNGQIPQDAAPRSKVPTDTQPATQTPAPPPQQQQQQSPSSNLDQAFQVPKQDFTSMKQEAAANNQVENQKWAEDLANQHITPKTYQSMFHDASVPGKIGTIFSLLLGGMGGGLTGTGNPVLGMMDKIISNDLEAQKTSKSNAQNFLRMSQEHEFQKAQQKLMDTQGTVNASQAAMLRQQTNAIAWPMAQAKAYQVALQTAVDQANKLPQGSPEWQKAQQHLAMMHQAVQGKTKDLNSEAASAEALMNYGQNGGGNDPEATFAQQQLMRRMTGQGDLANIEEQHHVPGHGRASQPVDQATRQKISSMENTHDLYNQALQMSQQYGGVNGVMQALKHPVERQKMNAMADTLRNSLIGSIKNQQQDGALTGEKANFLTSQVGNSPTSIWSAVTSNPHIKQLMLDDQQQYNHILQSNGLPPRQMPNQQQQQDAPPPKGMKRIMFQGKPYLVPQGQ